MMHSSQLLLMETAPAHLVFANKTLAWTLVCQRLHCWSDHHPDVVLKDLCSRLLLEPAQQLYLQSPSLLGGQGMVAALDSDCFLLLLHKRWLLPQLQLMQIPG